MNATAGTYGPIDVFRAGTFSPMSGPVQTITEQNLRDIAASYDQERAPAPVVIGHPDIDAPAFGWVDQLYVDQGILKATLKDTVAEFADLVKAGRYRKVSISLHLPTASANPAPGKFYLKHVGFLGAAAPAVPGLKPVKFSGPLGESLTFSQDRPGQLTSRIDLDEVSRLRHQLREREVEDLIGQGRVLPAFKEEVVAFAASLDDKEAVSFSDSGEAATRKAWFMSFLARQPKVVSFGEVPMGDDPLDGKPGRKRPVNIPDGYSADNSNAALLAAARRLVNERGVSFGDALDLVMAEAG